MAQVKSIRYKGNIYDLRDTSKTPQTEHDALETRVDALELLPAQVTQIGSNLGDLDGQINGKEEPYIFTSSKDFVAGQFTAETFPFELEVGSYNLELENASTIIGADKYIILKFVYEDDTTSENITFHHSKWEYGAYTIEKKVKQITWFYVQTGGSGVVGSGTITFVATNTSPHQREKGLADYVEALKPLIQEPIFDGEVSTLGNYKWNFIPLPKLEKNNKYEISIELEAIQSGVYYCNIKESEDADARNIYVLPIDSEKAKFEGEYIPDADYENAAIGVYASTRIVNAHITFGESNKGVIGEIEDIKTDIGKLSDNITTLSERVYSFIPKPVFDGEANTIGNYEWTIIPTDTELKANKKYKISLQTATAIDTTYYIQIRETESSSVNIYAVVVPTGTTEYNDEFTPLYDYPSPAIAVYSSTKAIEGHLVIEEEDGWNDDFSEINFGCDGDSITEGNQWSFKVFNKLGMATHHNVGVGSASYACREIEYNGTTYTTQEYSDPNFAGISNGYGTIPDAVEAQKRANNCAKCHVQKFIAEVESGEYPEPDIFCFSFGTNDAVPTEEQIVASTTSASYPSGEDLYNIVGGMRWAVQKIVETYPNCKVFVMLPIQGQGNMNAARNKNNLVKIEAIKKVATIMSVQVIDMFNNCGIRGILETGNGPYLYDGLHPNEKGRELMARCAAGYIKSLFVV